MHELCNKSNNIVLMRAK